MIRDFEFLYSLYQVAINSTGTKVNYVKLVCVCVCVCMYVCMYVCVYICMFVYMYVCV